MHVGTLAGPPILFLLLSVSSSLAAQEGKAEAPASSVKVRRAPFQQVAVEEGVLVPAHATALTVRPKAYPGKLRVLDVVAHGTAVEEGDVVLRLDRETLDAALRKAEWATRTKKIELRSARLTLEEGQENGERAREKAEQDLEVARHSLSGYREIQRPLDQRSYRRGEQAYIDSIQDQQDEIDQLGKMYKEDELTEATEELVLKRAHRKLAATKERLEIYRARFHYNTEYTETKTLQALERAVEEREKKLRKVERDVATNHEKAEITVERAEHELAISERNLARMRKDGRGFVLRAPHAGVVLHGNLVSASPANGIMDQNVAAKAMRRHDVVTAGRTLLTLAVPGAMKVRFALKAEDRYHARAGTFAAVLPKALPEVVLSATLEPLGRFPRADGKWTAHAVFGGDDDRLVPLLKCTVRMVLVDLPDALVVPSKALFQRDGRWYCHARDRSVFGLSARPVVRGPTGDKSTVILDGLKEGEEILLPGKAPLAKTAE